MYSIDAATLAALSRDHTVLNEATITDPNTGSNPLPGMVVTGGDVTVDATAQYRRTCRVTVQADAASIPGRPQDALAPFGNTVQLWRGLIVPASGLTPQRSVLFPLGIFRMSNTGVDENEDGTVDLHFAGSDFSRTVSRAKFQVPYIVAAGTNYITAITTLIQFILPTIVLDVPTTVEVTPQLVFDVGDDPWQHATEMAAALGMECFFTPDGAFKLQTVPDLSTASPVLSLVEGNYSPLTDVGREYDDDPGYNGVIVSAETSSLVVPFLQTVWDTNPSSPTYYLGKYGQVPAGPITSPYIASSGQALAFGNSWLLKNQGVGDQVTWSAIPNPALDASDVVYIQRGRSKIATNVVVQSLTIPLDVVSKMSGVGAKKAS